MTEIQTIINKPYFSVIIPNFKTEPFLEQCLDSVKNQTFKEFECIIISDGSPGVKINPQQNQESSISDNWFRSDYTNSYLPYEEDLSKQAETIFNNLFKKDKRFKFFTQKNIGQGPTRNRGIKLSKGKRVVFLDCDDFLKPYYLETVFNSLCKDNEDTQKIFFAEIENYQHGKIIPFEQTQKYVPMTNNLATILTFPTWTLGPVNYFWDIDILKKNNVIYLGGRGEDTKFIINCILAYYNEFGSKALENFIKIPKSGYIYRLFPFQNYRVENFEKELFHALTSFINLNLKSLKRMNLRYYFLGRLFILRFNLYIKRNDVKDNFKRRIINIKVKLFTLLAMTLSNFKKL